MSDHPATNEHQQLLALIKRAIVNPGLFVRRTDFAVPAWAARAVHTALTTGGHLLPDGGVRYYSWGLQLFRPDVRYVGAGSASEALARSAAARGDGRLMRRLCIDWERGHMYRGPWEPAPDPQQPEGGTL